MSSSRRARQDRVAQDAPPPLPAPLTADAVDTHCHLDLMGGPIPDAIAAAQAVGVRRVVTIGTDVASSRWCAQAAAEHLDVYAGVAIHPNESAGASEDALAQIAALAGQPQVRAIGETGLDYYRDTATPAQQQASFRAHIALAKQAGKALVIHDRDAHADVLALLASDGAPQRTVFHCFSGDTELARACAAAGYWMSFAGNVTFANAGALRAAAAVVPLELLLVETDAPFLTPTPYRGRTNAPYLVPLTVRALAETKGVSEQVLASAVGANAERVFGPW